MTATSLARARQVLRRLQLPHLLDDDAVAVRLRRALSARTAVEAVHRVLDEALRYQDPRIRCIVERCDVGRALGKAVAKEMYISPRQFYRLRAIAIDAVARRIDALLGPASICPGDVDAVALYARGKYFTGRRERTAFEAALRCFEGALAREPGFGRAYAGIAEVHLLSAEFEQGDSIVAFAAARYAIDRALEIDAGLAETLAAAGDFALFGEGNHVRARSLFEAALEADAGYTTTYQHAAWLEILECNYAKATAILREGLLREPESLVMQTTLGVAYLEMGQIDRAISQLRSGCPR